MRLEKDSFLPRDESEGQENRFALQCCALYARKGVIILEKKNKHTDVLGKNYHAEVMFLSLTIFSNMDRSFVYAISGCSILPAIDCDVAKFISNSF